MARIRVDGQEAMNTKAGGSTKRRAAELYVENMYAKPGNKKTDTQIILEAGYSPRTHSNDVIKAKGFQAEVERLIPKNKVLSRVSKGLDNPKDSQALGFCKLAAEIHGMTGAGASGNHTHIENANILVTDLIDWKPQGVFEDSK